MKVSRIIVKNPCKACDGVVAFQLDAPLSKNILSLLVGGGFNERTNFTKAGILYVERDGFIATGRFGSNTINTNCKRKGCEALIDAFEQILLKSE